jgi:YD repeat-containing protein
MKMRVITVAMVCVTVWSCAGAEPDVAPVAPKEKPAAGARVERSSEKGAAVELTYDARGNVIIKRVNIGTPQEAMWLYEYSETGQRLSEQAPDGTRTLYAYETTESTTPLRVKVIGPDGKEREYKPSSTN